MTQEFTPDFDPALSSSGIFSAPEVDATIPPVNESTIDERNMFDRSVHMASRGILRSAETAVIVAEVTPLNEAARWTVGGLAIKSGLPPEAVAAVYGGITLAIESTAAVVAARWLSGERGKKAVSWFNEKLQNRGISPDAKFNPITKAGVVFIGGSAVAQTVEVREQPEMEKQEIRKYGLKTAAILAGVCAVQGYFVGKGFDAPSPATIGGATVAVGSIFGIGGWAKNRVNSEQSAQGIDGKSLQHEAKERRIAAKVQRKQEKLNRRNMK